MVMCIMLGISACAGIMGKKKQNDKKKDIKEETNYKHGNIKYEFSCYFQVVKDKTDRPLPLPGPLIRHVVSKNRNKNEIKKMKKTNERYGINTVKPNCKIVITNDNLIVIVKNQEDSLVGGTGVDERFRNHGAVHLNDLVWRKEAHPEDGRAH
eukprot:Pgem_evm1s9564